MPTTPHLGQARPAGHWTSPSRSKQGVCYICLPDFLADHPNSTRYTASDPNHLPLNSILSILPDALFILCALPRLFYLLKRNDLLLARPHRGFRFLLKACVALITIAVNVAFLAIVQSEKGLKKNVPSSYVGALALGLLSTVSFSVSLSLVPISLSHPEII